MPRGPKGGEQSPDWRFMDGAGPPPAPSCLVPKRPQLSPALGPFLSGNRFAPTIHSSRTVEAVVSRK
jgi:hypothetical protein